jgi:hypothetical protein
VAENRAANLAKDANALAERAKRHVAELPPAQARLSSFVWVSAIEVPEQERHD